MTGDLFKRVYLRTQPRVMTSGVIEADTVSKWAVGTLLERFLVPIGSHPY